MADWRFITNHGLVLAAIARRIGSTAREIGDAAGITERAALKIINDLNKGGFISKIKIGRQNRYRIHRNAPINEDIPDSSIGELLRVLGVKRRRGRKNSIKTDTDG